MSKIEIYDSEESKFEAPLRAKDGEIKNYEIDADVFYPAVFVYVGKGIRNYVQKAFTSCVNPIPSIKTDIPENCYYVYMIFANSTDAESVIRKAMKILVGYISRDKFRILLDGGFFRTFEKKLYLDKETVEEGPILYSYCTFNNL